MQKPPAIAGRCSPPFLVLLVLIWTAPFARSAPPDTTLESLVKAEQRFAQMSLEQGHRAAFLAFLAEDAVLFRPDPVPGRKAVEERPSAGTLSWRPVHAEISSAGDMGYTTGPYEYRDTARPDHVSHGEFVSVWKKQESGEWRVVIDLGISHAPPVARVPDWGHSQLKPRSPMNTIGCDTDSAIVGLLELDRVFSDESGKVGALRAYRGRLSATARLFRAGAYPLISPDSIHHRLSQVHEMTWMPLAARVAVSCDLACTYGSYALRAGDSREKETGYYLRVWTADHGGRWVLTVDITNPVPPAPSRQ